MKKRLFVNLLTILTLTLSFVSCGENKDSKEEPSSIETTTSKPTSETTSNQEPTSETTTSEVTTSEAPTSEVVSSETPTIESSSTENELVDVDIVSVKNELRDIAALNQQQDLSKIKQLKISYSEYETYYSNGGEQKEGGHMDGYFDLDKLEGF